MRKLKVYFAKSNMFNPIIGAEIRHILTQTNCEIVEFKGGKYSDTPMMESDVLLVLGADSLPFVGRGLYGQIGLALKAPKFIGKTAYVVSDNLSPVTVSKVISIATHDTEDWKAKYGKIILDSQRINLISFLDSIARPDSEQGEVPMLHTGPIPTF